MMVSLLCFYSWFVEHTGPALAPMRRCMAPCCTEWLWVSDVFLNLSKMMHAFFAAWPVCSDYFWDYSIGPKRGTRFSEKSDAKTRIESFVPIPIPVHDAKVLIRDKNPSPTLPTRGRGLSCLRRVLCSNFRHDALTPCGMRVRL
jgi:hypothetical protein